MQHRQLGKNGPRVSALGLGCMAFSGGYGTPDDAESIATIRAALDAGITYLDSGDFYGMGHNEMLLREALKGRARDQAFISIKFGALRTPDLKWNGYDLRPVAIRNFVTYSLRRLGTDYIDLYQPARLDPAVPVEDVVGTIADLVKQGYVRHVGLSEASAKSIARAQAVAPIAALANRIFAVQPRHRGCDPAGDPRARHRACCLWCAVARSDLSASDGVDRQQPVSADACRAFTAKISPSMRSWSRPCRPLPPISASPLPQLAFAWVLSRGDDVVPLVGARNRTQLADILKSADVTLSPDDLRRIEAAVPKDSVAGTRYGAEQTGASRQRDGLTRRGFADEGGRSPALFIALARSNRCHALPPGRTTV